MWMRVPTGGADGLWLRLIWLLLAVFLTSFTALSAETVQVEPGPEGFPESDCSLNVSLKKADLLTNGESQNLRVFLQPLAENPPLIRTLSLDRIKGQLGSFQDTTADRDAAEELYLAIREREEELSVRCLYEMLFVLYQLFDPQNLDEADRLTKGCVFLRHAFFSRLPTQFSLRGDEFVRETFADFHRVLKARAEVQSTETREDVREELRAEWGISDASLKEVRQFVEDFLKGSAHLGMTYPDLGPKLGSWVAPVLRSAIEVFAGDVFEETLKESYEWLVELDQGNLTGPSYFFEANRLTKRDLSPLDLNVRAANVIARRDEVVRLLEKGDAFLDSDARIWMPYQRYSDDLYQLAATLRDQRKGAGAHDTLSEFSCRVLYEGICRYFSRTRRPDLGELRDARTTLFQRVKERTVALQYQTRLEESISFASVFFEIDGGFEREQAEEIHGLLARAHFVMGNQKRAMEHLDKSGGRLSFQDLEDYRLAVGRFVK